MRTIIHPEVPMTRLLLLLLLLAACAGESKPLVLGEPTWTPYGYTVMCRERPEEFACPRR